MESVFDRVRDSVESPRKLKILVSGKRDHPLFKIAERIFSWGLIQFTEKDYQRALDELGLDVDSSAKIFLEFGAAKLVQKKPEIYEFIFVGDDAPAQVVEKAAPFVPVERPKKNEDATLSRIERRLGFIESRVKEITHILDNLEGLEAERSSLQAEAKILGQFLEVKE